MRKTGKLIEIVPVELLGPDAEKLSIKFHSEGEYFIEYCLESIGQTIPYDKAIELSIWLSTAITDIRFADAEDDL